MKAIAGTLLLFLTTWISPAAARDTCIVVAKDGHWIRSEPLWTGAKIHLLKRGERVPKDGYVVNWSAGYPSEWAHVIHGHSSAKLYKGWVNQDPKIVSCP